MFKLSDVQKFVEDLEDETQDAVQKFCNKGNYFRKFIQVLQDEEVAQKVQDAGLVLSAVTPFIVRSQSDLPNLEQDAIEVSQELVSSHLKIIEKLLSSDKKFSVIALKLLTAIVTINYDLAKEILLELQITGDTMDNLASNQKVRPFFIEFILSFIRKNSSALFSLLVSKPKNMFNTIIVGLVVDECEDVVKFLSTVENFLKTVQLADNLKLNAFQSSTLAHLAELYKWQGPPGFKKFFKPVKTVKKAKLDPVGEVDENEKGLVRSKAHEFLELLCTSEQYGIVTSDLVFKAAVDQTNGYLINFLKNKVLDNVWTDELQANLLTKTLTVSPNLLETVFHKVSVSSTQVSLLIKIVHQIVENSKCYGNSLRLENYPEVTLKLCLPQCLCSSIKDALDSSDTMLCYATINFLIACMKKLNEYIELHSNRHGTRNINNHFTNYIQKNVASAELLSSIWTKEIDFRTVIAEDGRKLTEEMYLSSLAELLILFSDLSPSFADKIRQHFAEISYDSCLFFSAAPFLKVFSLLIYLNKIDVNQVEFRHGLQRVIVIMISEKNLEAKQLFYKLMINSRLVNGDEHELATWVHSFSTVGSGHAEKVAELFALAVEYLANESSELVKVSDELDESSRKHLTAEENIEEFINKVTHGLIDLTLFASSSTRVNISLLFLAFLKNFANDDRKMNSAVAKSVNKFLVNLIVHAFHSQTNLEGFCLLVSKDTYQDIIPGELKKYTKSWLSKKPSKSLKSLYLCGFDDTSLEAQLLQLAVSPNASQQKALLESLNQTSPEHLTLLFRFCIFIAAQNILQGSSSAPLAECLSSIIVFILKCLPNTSAEPCVQFMLTHPTILESFLPLDVSNESKNSVAIVLPILMEVQPLIPNKALAPYKLRFLKQLKCQIEDKNELKGSKKVVSEVTGCLKLSDKEAAEVIDQIFKNFESLTDTWNDIVAQLLEIISQSRLNEPLPSHLVAALCSRLPNKRLQQALTSYINGFPHSIEFIPPEFINKLLKLKEISPLALLLFSHNPSFIETVIKDWESIKNKPTMIFPILTAVSGNTDLQDEILKEVTQSHLSCLSTHVLSPPAWFLENNQIGSQLLYRFIENGEALEECKKIEEMWFEIDVNLDVIPLLETLFNKAGQTLKLIELLLSWTVQLIMSHKLDQIGSLLETISDCCLIDKSSRNYHSLSKLAVWSQFGKLALKHGLGEENQPLLSCLAVISGAVFSSNQSEGAQSLFELLVSHPNFIKTILSKSECKESLLKIFLTLVRADYTLMKANHVPLFLGAYNASLSTADQIILQILRTYEECGVKLNKCQPYIWGEAAVNHFTVRSKTVTLHKQLPPVKLLDLLDASRIDATIKRFPIGRDEKMGDLIEPDNQIYDPAFLIPVLNSILATESPVRWFQITRSRAISIIFASLALEDPVLRNTAYLTLSKFYQLLETGEKSRALWIQFLDIIRNGIADAGLNQSNTTPQLSSVITTFLARTAITLIEPSGPNFKPLVSFVTVKPTLRLNQVPEFLILFFSADKDTKLHRKFILEVMRDGIRCEADWKLCQSYVFKIILTFYSSSLADDETKELILDVMKSVVKIQNAAIYMATSYGFMSWLSHEIRTLQGPTAKCVALLTEILSILGANLPVRYSGSVLNLLLFLAENVTSLNSHYLSMFISSLRFTSRKARMLIKSKTLSSLLTKITTKISPSTHQTCQYFLKYGTKYSPSVSVEDSESVDQNLMALFVDYL
ncbi:unnamed protein product [Bemisia tabaci]|uniref:Nucleolar pre-ribosomal-associated protein 1 n=1 Tax=Bemisia tabaci TaxID=7038 RepID=A0A9P0F4N5_BEMTA|nr:unnamed protein product [Bemisia tabaci]